MDRYETVLKDIEKTFQTLKAERLNNLKQITPNISDISANENVPKFNYSDLMKGKIPSISLIISQLESCGNWNQLRIILAVLKEIRFLGSPKRKDISVVLLKKIAEIYENCSDGVDCNRDEELVRYLNELLAFDQMNPLIVPKECSEDATEALKTVIYTAQDILKQIK